MAALPVVSHSRGGCTERASAWISLACEWGPRVGAASRVQGHTFRSYSQNGDDGGSGRRVGSDGTFSLSPSAKLFAGTQKALMECELNE